MFLVFFFIRVKSMAVIGGQNRDWRVLTKSVNHQSKGPLNPIDCPLRKSNLGGPGSFPARSRCRCTGGLLKSGPLACKSPHQNPGDGV